MRILWLSPWLRTLTRVQVDALTAAGHECRIVTTDQHYEKVTARPDERVLDPRIKDLRLLAPVLRTWREMRAWGPDVVVSELMHDPRWLPMTRLAPLVHVIHDDRPHDAAEHRPLHRRLVLDHLTRTADRVVAPSRHVAGAVAARFHRPVDVVPLTSDVPEADLPPVPRPAAERRDMVVLGRMSAYKNVPLTLQAWARHASSPAWRGDRLLLLGDGDLDPGAVAGPHVEWRRERFAYADVLPVLAGAKASVAHYRLATQSGVQVLSAQCGVTPVVSDSGGLPEFATPGSPPIGVDDVDALTAAFDALADPVTAAECGALARSDYVARFSADRVATIWTDLFTELAAPVPAAR
jgi:glycosyltransferase involved in cell wall biosynthesis